MKITMETRNENMTTWKATHPGVILKYELEERELSQKEFSELIGMQKSHVSEIIKGKRNITKNIADKIEKALGISAVSLVNLQTQYEHDIKIIEQNSIEEQKAINKLKLYNEVVDVNTIFKRCGIILKSAIEKVNYLKEVCRLPKPAELQLEVAGRFKKSNKTGLDTRMLMTWKILAETTAEKQKAEGVFNSEDEHNVVAELKSILHNNHETESMVKNILSKYGIVFCIEEKVDKASVDGYSYKENGTPYIILTKRYNRIDNFAFSLMHEIGHVYLNHLEEGRQNGKLNIIDYENDTFEEQANKYAADALIPANLWKNSPKVRLNNPIAIQKVYSLWAEANNMNKWIVIGRISHATGIYKFKSDDSRKIG